MTSWNNISMTIGWATRSWNPVTGCKHGCPYCYARFRSPVTDKLAELKTDKACLDEQS